MQRFKKHARLIIVCLIVLLCSYKLIIASEIKSIVQEQGGDNLELYIDHVGFTSARLRDIALGGKRPFTISQMAVTYLPSARWTHNFETITIDRMVIEADIDADNKLSLHGLDAFIRGMIPKNTANVLPNYMFYPDDNFSELIVKSGVLHISGTDTDVSIPFGFAVHKQGRYRMDLTLGATKGTLRGLTIATHNTAAQMELDAKKSRWNGLWNIDNVAIQASQLDFDGLTASGRFYLTSASAHTTFMLGSKDPLAGANFAFDLNGKDAIVTVNECHFPWAHGIVSVKPVSISLQRKNSVNMYVQLTDVAADAFFNAFGAEKADGNGTVSGTIPMGITTNNKLLFYRGEVHSDEAGNISGLEDLLPPGDKLRAVLLNFHYDMLSVMLESGIGNSVSMHFNAVGHNPDIRKSESGPVSAVLKGTVENVNQRVIPPSAEKSEEPAVKEFVPGL